MNIKLTGCLRANPTRLPSALTLTMLLGAAGAAANPYPLSPILEGISWNEASKQRYAGDSDLWDLSLIHI